MFTIQLKSENESEKTTLELKQKEHQERADLDNCKKEILKQMS